MKRDDGGATRAKEFSFYLWQDGICVASVHGGDGGSAFGEIMHYARVYAQDGPVQVGRNRRKPPVGPALKPESE